MKLELRSVRIKNYGPIDDITIDFCDQQGKPLSVCVIGGANGSGKTTVLEVINSLLKILTRETLSTDLFSRRSTYLQLDCVTNANPFSLYGGAKPADAVLEKDNCSYGWTESDVTGLISGIAEKAGAPVSLLSIVQRKSSPFSKDDKMPSVLYFPYNRSLEPVTGYEIQKEVLPYRFVQRIDSVRQFKGSLNSHLVWLDYAEPEEFKKIRQFLNNLDLDGKTFHISRKDLAVIVRTKNRQEHLLHELSSGEQNLLIILIELYRRLLPGSVVLIDEIENSLHPAFQHRLAQGLLKLQKEIPYQLIVTTHSPTFVEIFGAENTRILTPF